MGATCQQLPENASKIPDAVNLKEKPKNVLTNSCLRLRNWLAIFSLPNLLVCSLKNKLSSKYMYCLCTLSDKDRGATKNPAVDLEIILIHHFSS